MNAKNVKPFTIQVWGCVAGTEPEGQRMPPFLTEGDKYLTGSLVSETNRVYRFSAFAPLDPSKKHSYFGQIRQKDDDGDYHKIARIIFYKDGQGGFYGYVNVNDAYTEIPGIIDELSLRFNIQRNSNTNSKAPTFVGTTQYHEQRLRQQS